MLQVRTVVFLMWKLAGNGEYDLIDMSARGIGQRKMCSRHGVKSSRNNANAIRGHRRFLSANGSREYSTRPLASTAPA